MTVRAAALVLAASLVAACGGSSRTPPERFGERRPTTVLRETLTLAAPADSAAFFLYPAVLDSVGVRPERRTVAPGETVGVEVVVQGALPDVCSDLHALRQTRAGQFVTVELTMRQPRGRTCARVARPFRFYLRLDDRYGPGSYVVRVNGSTAPFQIREAPAARG